MSELCWQVKGFYDSYDTYNEMGSETLVAVEEVVLQFCQKHIGAIMGNREFTRLFQEHSQVPTKILSYTMEASAE